MREHESGREGMGGDDALSLSYEEWRGRMAEWGAGVPRRSDLRLDLWPEGLQLS